MKNIPSPETLRPLLEAALAVMAPNDPSREELRVDATLTANGRAYFCLCFFSCAEAPRRYCHATGTTPAEALENFRAKYTPPLTKDNRIAALRAELATLEAGQ